MLVAGIIAEYNPFHNGHAHHIQQTKQHGASHIIAVMSGNFVQRGEAAILDKMTRAEMAVACGVDLVIELPTVFSTGYAQRFASGAVTTLQALGCVDILSFGSECSDLNLLIQAKNALSSEEVLLQTKYYLQQGLSYPLSRSRAVQSQFGDDLANIISTPNNMLGIEYLSAISSLNTNIDPFAICRQGALHDDMRTNENIASASYLRKCCLSNDYKHVKKYMPKNAYEIMTMQFKNGNAPYLLENSYKAVLAKLRMYSVEELGELLDVSEGLQFRLFDAIKNATNLDELYAQVKTKRYTMARIRRLVLYAYLCITNAAPGQPEYIKVLAFNSKGRELLRIIKRTATLPIIQQYSDIKMLNPSVTSLYNDECLYTDLYNLCTETPMPCGQEQRQNSKFIKE